MDRSKWSGAWFERRPRAGGRTATRAHSTNDRAAPCDTITPFGIAGRPRRVEDVGEVADVRRGQCAGTCRSIAEATGIRLSPAPAQHRDPRGGRVDRARGLRGAEQRRHAAVRRDERRRAAAARSGRSERTRRPLRRTPQTPDHGLDRLRRRGCRRGPRGERPVSDELPARRRRSPGRAPRRSGARPPGTETASRPGYGHDHRSSRMRPARAAIVQSPRWRATISAGSPRSPSRSSLPRRREGPVRSRTPPCSRRRRRSRWRRGSTGRSTRSRRAWPSPTPCSPASPGSSARPSCRGGAGPSRAGPSCR